MVTAAKRVSSPEKLSLLERARESTQTLNWLNEMRADYAWLFHVGARLMKNMRQQKRWDENADNIINTSVELAGQKIEQLDKAIEAHTIKHNALMVALEECED